MQTATVVISDTTAPVANITNLPTVTGQCSATVTAQLQQIIVLDYYWYNNIDH
jgi:hypothetical protein